MTDLGCWAAAGELKRPHPESVPINALQRVAGTPLADRPAVDAIIEFVRMVATHGADIDAGELFAAIGGASGDDG